MKKHITVHETRYFNISEYRNYQYFHHPTGMSIAVLPILARGCMLQILTPTTPQNLLKKIRHPMIAHNSAVEVLQPLFGFRREDLPCWQASYPGIDRLHWTCVTGGLDPKDRGVIPNAMFRELKEEMGIEVHESSCVTEGPMFTGKGGNLQVAHFVLTITKAAIVPREPDSEFDAAAECYWLTHDEVLTTSPEFDLHSRHLLKMAKF